MTGDALFDLDPTQGGRPVDESRSRKGKTRRPDRNGTTCPRCSQLVQPGPHTVTRPTGTTICQEDQPR